MGLFRKKREEKEKIGASPPLSEQFTLNVLESATDDHQQKLKQEVRSCPVCSYQIINPMTDRCPRCFSQITLSEHTNCGECDYQGNCALASVHNAK